MTTTTMQVLPGRLRVETEASVPPDRLRPVLVHASGRRIWLAHGPANLLPPPSPQRQQIEFPCDLAAHARRATRLQLWADGFLLHEQPLHTASACAVTGIADYSLTGWITADTPAMLHLDGTPLRPITPHPPDATTPPSHLRLSEPLPASALDGRRHRIDIVSGRHVLATLSFQSRLRVDLAMRRDHLTLDLADPALTHGPVSITTEDLTTRIRTSHGTVAPSGGTIRIAIPPHAGLLVLCAGHDAQLELARLLPQSPADQVARARAAARQTLLIDPGAPESRNHVAPRLPVADAPSHRLHPTGAGRGVTVVVPICKGVLETRDCLASLHAACTGHDAIDAIILVDDASLDPAMDIVLATQAALQETVKVILLRQPERRGFVQAITAGIAAADPSHDVILLNADTVVPPRFAARLRAAAHARPGIASATPLSNNATVLSLPDAQSHAQPDAQMAPTLTQAELRTLDTHLERAHAPPVDIPTGIGFCLYLRREALADIGGFDPGWGQGYCEEVDWCLRARDRGWSHVAAADLAVYHHGSVSFGTAARAAILAQNHPRLEARYPEYQTELRHFLATDPLAKPRAETFRRTLEAHATHCLLHFTHAMGGGTAILVAALAARFAVTPGHANLVCARTTDSFSGADIFHITWVERGLSLRMAHTGIDDFVRELAVTNLTLRILLHSLTGAGPAIRDILTQPIPYAVYVHDYQWSCPRVTVVDHTGLHCNEPGLRCCQLCVCANPTPDFGSEGDDIRADLAGWITANDRLLTAAVAVIVPSHDTLIRLRRQFPTARLRVVPPPDHTEPARISRAGDRQDITRIAVVGGLGLHQGHDILHRLAAAIEAAHAPIEIDIFGAAEHAEAFRHRPCVRLHGPYARADLPGLLTEAHPHFVFFPAIWPQTWSFALSDVWQAGYPAIAFDIGAIAERIRTTGAGALLAFPPEHNLIAPLLQARQTVAALAGHRFHIAQPTSDNPINELFQSR